MRALLLTAAVLLSVSGSVSAQNFPPDYRFEIGINGGGCLNTVPQGAQQNYEGKSSLVVPDFSLRFNYNITPHWQVNADIGERKFATYGNVPVEYTYGQSLQTRNQTFLIAKQAINESIELNYVIPFYSKFHVYNKSNLYFGAMLGLMTTVNDGSIKYSKYNSLPDSNLQYVSQYNYGPGIGYTYGLQIGYTYYFFKSFGVNIEIAARYTDVGTNDTKYDHANARYGLYYFPETIGLRYRF